MARRFRPRGFVRPPKRTVMWIGKIPGNAPLAVGANTGVLVSTLNAAALALRPFTVMRTRGIVHWETDQLAASETPFGVVASIVVTESAAAAGAGSIPTPTTENDSDRPVSAVVRSLVAGT